MYNFVCPAKQKLVVFDKHVDLVLKKICLEIADRYEVHFLEIETDRDHIHLLIQSVPMHGPKKIIESVKA